MFSVSNSNVISLTRGDSAAFSVPITNTVTDETYSPASTDKFFFTVKKTTADTTYLIQAVSTGVASFHIRPADTKSLAFGKYVYDVQLTTAAGDVYTVIEPTTFKVLEEVT